MADFLRCLETPFLVFLEVIEYECDSYQKQGNAANRTANYCRYLLLLWGLRWRVASAWLRILSGLRGADAW